MQEKVVEANKSKNFQLLGVDLWNGSARQVNEFAFVTQAKFPLLQNGRNPEFSFGLGVENVIVMDQEGIVRGWYADVDTDKINALIDLILVPAPLSELSPKSLYYGLTGEVGVERSITVKVENAGLTPLEVRDIRPSSADVIVDRTTFTVLPGEETSFTATLSPTKVGTLSGSVEVITNEKNWSLQIASIEISSPPPPLIALQASSLDFGAVEVGRTATRTLAITNDGLGPLKVSGIESEVSGVTFSEHAFTVSPGETKTITIVVTPGQDGNISGAINVLSDDPSHEIMSVELSGLAQVVPGDARADFDGSGTIDFGDFLGFAGAFGTTDVGYDVDKSGAVDFSDFLVFVENFGRQVF